MQCDSDINALQWTAETWENISRPQPPCRRVSVMDEGGLEEKRHQRHGPHINSVSLHAMYITLAATLPFNINHRQQGCSVSIATKNDHLNKVNVSDCVRSGCTKTTREPCTYTDHHGSLPPALPENNCLLYGKKNGEWSCTLCCFISKVLSLPLLQNTDKTSSIQPSRPIKMSGVIVYWEGSHHMYLLWLRFFQNSKWSVTNRCTPCSWCAQTQSPGYQT